MHRPRLAAKSLAVASFFAFAVPIASGQEAATADWPWWRGPDRDGVSRETAWSSAGRPEPLWRAEVGLGYSSVTVSAGRLYTIGHDAEAVTDHIVCLDARTGDGIWAHELAVDTMANFHGGGSLTTPTVDGEVVYVTNRVGLCLCLDARTGEVRWERDYKEELGLEIGEYGYGASPLVVGDRLYLALGGTILAANKDDGGSLIWKTDDYGEGGYATPVPFALGDRSCLAVFSGPGLVVLDAETGEEMYLHPMKGEQGSVNACTPIVVGDRVFVSAAYGSGAALVKLGEAPEPELVWHSRRMRNKVSGCTLWEGHVYGFDESMLKCLGWEDGDEKWRVRGLGMGSVAVAGGRLIALSSDGELIVAEARPDEYRELYRHKVLDGGVYWTTPVLVDGLIYCRNSLGHLVCMDHRPRAGAADVTTAAVEQGETSVPAAEALFARHAERIGAEVLRGRKSAHLEGWFENTGAGITKSPLVIDWVAPDRWRIAYDLGTFGTVERCYDGEIGWQLDPFYGNLLYEGDALRELKETRRFHGDVEWRKGLESLRTTGRVRFDDRDCWAVEVETEAGSRRTIYFDAETGLRTGRDAETEHMVVHEDYRDFDGVQLPAFSRYLVPDTGDDERVWIEKVVWDAVDEAVFERPVEVVKMLRTPEQIAVDEARLVAEYGTYFGKYVAQEGPSKGQAFEMKVADGSLVVVIPGPGPFPLSEPDEEGRFYFPPTRIYVTFELDADGAPTAMIMHGAPGAPDPQTLPRLEDDD